MGYTGRMEERNIPDLLFVDKPKGITSFDVIRALRKKLGVRKMGHAGTLDPLATGLMIIGIGSGTKKLGEYLKLSKTYEAEILLGVGTDTGDVSGRITGRKDTARIEEGAIRDAVKRVEGIHSFRVPMYSAVKVKGKPLYAYARKGEKDMAPEREMRVNRAEVTSIAREDGNTAVFVTFDVESGTYIRTLAEAIGKELGVPAALRNLRRTRIGAFTLKDSISFDELCGE